MNHDLQPHTPARILVIEDSEEYRDTLKMMLSDAGYDVLEASDGAEGLEAAQKHRPDLILCDIIMPNMDGLEMLSAMKDIPDLAKIPLIFLTGRNDMRDVRLGMLQGADDYLTKPFTVNELLEAVRTRLAKDRRLQMYYASQNEEVKNSLGLFLPHEIHTPLNAIIGIAELLQDPQDFASDEIREYAGLILESGQRLYRLLENFNLFSQVQFWMHDESTIGMMRRQISPPVHEVFAAMINGKYAAHERRASLDVRLPAGSAQISREYLAKIFEELIDNAFKFSDSGTEVSVSAEETPDELCITIRDRGRGMTEEQIAKVSAYMQFERRQYEQQGAGLGLAVSRALAELHGGSLMIESAPGSGCAVTLRLPAVPR